MYGMISVTTSPSSFNSRRSTPCVLGCCGPMLTYISSIVSWVRSAISISCGFICLPQLKTSLKRLVRNQPFVLIVLAQRIPHPVFREQDPSEIRMTIEADPHHVEGLPFMPVRRSPQRYHAPDSRLLPRTPHPRQDLCRQRQRGKVIHHLKLAARNSIDSAQTVQKVEPHPLERSEDFVALLALDIHPGLDTLDLRRLNRVTESRLEGFNDLVRRHQTLSRAPLRQA